MIAAIHRMPVVFHPEGPETSSPDGMRIVITASYDTTTRRDGGVFKDQQEVIDAVRSKLSRCLAAGERAEVYLPPTGIETDPRFCRSAE